MPECLRKQHFHRKVIVCLFLLCRLILFCLPVSVQAEKTTTAVNCEQLIPGLPLPKLPRLITEFQAWGGISPEVLQPAQPDRRFSWQPLFLKPSWPEAEPTVTAREQTLEALKASLIPDNLPPWQQQVLSEQWQQLISFNSALHELLLAMYQMLLEQEPMDDSQPDDYSPMVSAAGGGGDDDGNSDDDSDQDDKLPDIILDFALLPALLTGTDSDLLTLSILEQRSRLRQLRRRLARMVASGRSTMAAILRDRIMVIEADEEDLLNLAVSPEQKGQMILPLLEKMLESLTEDTLMPVEYDYAGNLRQAPVEQADTPKNSQNTLSGQGASGTSPNNVRSQKQPGQISGRRTNDDDDDEDQRPGQKKAVANRTPEAICCVCGQWIPKNEPLIISRIENKIYCQKHHPPFILSLPEVALLHLAEYLEWKDIISLTMTCRDLWALRQNNPVPLFLGPLVCKMREDHQDTDHQDTDITKNTYGTDNEIKRRLRQFNIPEAVISKAIQADSTFYLQLLHNFLLKYKTYDFDVKYTQYPERVFCLQSLSNGNFACGLGNGKVIIVNEELIEQTTLSFPFEKYSGLFTFFGFFKEKEPPVVSIIELSDRRLLLGITDNPDWVGNKAAVYSLAVDKVLTSVALWDSETDAWFVFPKVVIEPGIRAVVPLADQRLVFYNHRSRSLRVWSTRKGEEKELLTLAMDSPVVATHYQEKEQKLLIGHVDGMVSVWNTGQADPAPPRNLLTENQFFAYNPSCELMIMKLFSGKRLAMAFDVDIRIWDIASDPVVCHASLDLKGDIAGRFSYGDSVQEPIVESWIELQDHRLAILFRWPRQYGSRVSLIFWDTAPGYVTFIIDSIKAACGDPRSKLCIYGMTPLFGHHILLASQRSEIILCSTIAGKERELHYSVDHEFDDFIDLEPPLIILPGSRILTCFGGRYLCVLEMLCGQEDR